MKIEVGEYVRTKNGRIGKLDEIYYAGREIDLPRYYDKDLYNNYYIIKYNADDEFGKYSGEEIVSHSKNIIDLIEVGDYVNGARAVSEKYHYNKINFINVDSEISYGWGEGAIMEKEIESIVTKEQFSNMEYRL